LKGVAGFANSIHLISFELLFFVETFFVSLLLLFFVETFLETFSIV